MLAIIPARGGSKGLPGKNLKLLDDKPLIYYSIKAALDSKLINRVIVSTDNEEIASIAKNFGAEVFMRPANLAEDDSMVIDTYLNVVDLIFQQHSKPIVSFVSLLPTSPLRTSKDVDEAIKIFNDKNANSVISVVEASVPLHWHKQITDNGQLKNFLPEFDTIKNRQELKKAYVPNGAIYVFKTEVLRLERQYYTNKTYPFIMPKERSADIDDDFDFEWAKYLFKKNNKKSK
tara:strand:- start:1390 stop:2085 length:696 start_codon:yes stop_codon:yes gene_type:complete